MKTRPIIMSGESVLSILDGRKTQTRRVCNPQPEIKNGFIYGLRYGAGEIFMREQPSGLFDINFSVGDILWVKESFCVLPSGYYYRATDQQTRASRDGIIKGGAMLAGGVTWKNSMFMPRTASRLKLKITDVRVERVNEIGEADALAEGFTWHNFRGAWDNLNERRGFSWEKNPWVWVLKFEVQRP